DLASAQAEVAPGGGVAGERRDLDGARRLPERLGEERADHLEPVGGHDIFTHVPFPPSLPGLGNAPGAKTMTPAASSPARTVASVVTTEPRTRAPGSTTASSQRMLRSTTAPRPTRARAPTTDRRTRAAGSILAAGSTSFSLVRRLTISSCAFRYKLGAPRSYHVPRTRTPSSFSPSSTTGP